MDVMMSMTTADVRRLRGQFTRPLHLDAFVALLQSSLRDRIHCELDFVVAVIELFHTIDVNGDGQLDWDEFAAYMMDAGIARADFSANVELPTADTNAVTAFGDTRVLSDKQYAPLELLPRDPKTPLNRVKSHIQQLVLAHDLDAIAYFEANSDVVYMYSLHFDRNEGPRHLSTLRLHTAFQEHVVIGMAYVPNGRRLLITSSILASGFLSIWSVADARNPAMVRRFEATGALEFPVWLPSLKCVAVSHVLVPRVAPTRGSRHHSSLQQPSALRSTGSYFRPNAGTDQPYTRSNEILLWNLSDKKPASQRVAETSASGLASRTLSADDSCAPAVIRDTMRGVTALVVFKWANRSLLAIGREDGVVSVVDAEESRDVHEFDAHGSGVKSLAYSEAVDCLASIGFYSFADETTLDVLIWKRHASAASSSSSTTGSTPSPSSSSLSMKMVEEARLRGHEAPVELLAFVDSKRQLVTADRSETFLVFSSVMRTPTSDPWECLQRFSSVDAVPIGPRAPQTLWSMTVVPQTRASDAVLITAGEKFCLYDHCQVRDHDEGLLVFFTYYCSALNVIVGATSAKLMLWRADTGVLWKSYDYASFATDSTRLMTSRHGSLHEYDSECHSGVITAVCVDDRERKLIVGDDAGAIRVLNAVNGNVMKRLDPHSRGAAVVALAYVLHGKCVISISAASELHICDEDQPAGYYVPFGGAPPESVLLQSLRFSRRPLTTVSVGTSEQRFSILHAVANQALGIIAVLVHGSRGESFVQLWDFELSHALGTCVLPSPSPLTNGEEEEEITAVELFASSGDIVVGTSCGRVLLWPDPGRTSPSYNHVLEFPAAHLSDPDDQRASSSMSGSILFLSTMAIQLPSDADNRNEPIASSDGGEANVSSLPQRAPSISTKEWARIFLRGHSIDDRVLSEQHAGVFVVTGDDQGFVTVWVVCRRPEYASDPPEVVKATFMTHTDGLQPPSLSTASIPVPRADQVAGRSRKYTSSSDRSMDRGRKSILQHSETVVGSDTLDALFQHAKAGRREAGIPRAVSPTPEQSVPERLEATLTCHWRAHGEAIASLELSSDPCAVLTSSSSGKIKVWSLTSDLLGVIDQRATRRAPTTHPWAFPVDMEDRRHRQEREAERYIVNSTNSAATRGSLKTGTGWRPSLRSSVLQDRLSLTDHELSALTHSRDTIGEGRTLHHRPLQLRPSDVGRAIRNYVLRQAAPTSAPPGPHSRKYRSQSIGEGAVGDSGDDDQPLQAVLKEVEQFQLADCDKSKPPVLGPVTSNRHGRTTRWPIVTLASVKAFAFSSGSTAPGSRVHCGFPSLMPSRRPASPLHSPSKQQRERQLVAIADLDRRREVFISSNDHSSNQNEQSELIAMTRNRLTVRNAGRGGKDLLRHHANLANTRNPPSQ